MASPSHSSLKRKHDTPMPPLSHHDPLFNVTPDCLQHPEQLSLTQNGIAYTITMAQFVHQHDRYAKHPLPDDLFPWLHGVDGLDHQQSLFFGVRKVVVPKHRGLMLVHAGSSSAEDHVKRLAYSLPADLLVEQQLSPDTNQPVWQFRKDPEALHGIHLRNFSIQSWRCASISDLVVFGPHAKTVACRLAQAQECIHRERQQYHQRLALSAGKRAVVNANDLQYRIFIISGKICQCWRNQTESFIFSLDAFDTIQQNFPEWVWYDDQGTQQQCLSLADMEKQEMNQFTRASQITDHLWVGSSHDVPVFDHDDQVAQLNNPLGFSVCIECHDLAEMTCQSELTLARAMLEERDQDQVPPELMHLDMYSTGAVMDSAQDLDAFLASLKDLLMFMDDMTRQGRNVLIHSLDAYSESSLLVLTWMMYKQDLSLRDAYLSLQHQRSFFVFASDVPLLQVVDHFLRQSSALDYYKQKWIASLHNNTPSQLLDHPSRLLMTDQTIHEISHPQPLTLAVNPLPSNPDKDDWLSCPHFEGSFPSRMLPFLYLGNLNHATNPAMLKALGISYVVSVGENADLNNQDFQHLFLDNLYDDGIDSVKSQYDRTVAFVDEAHKRGAKCLIHCRVGVSRSAALTIAYVMHHFEPLSLVAAYTLVRARRLNVIIQPNLKFMYELLQLEQQLTGRFIVPWHFLSHQIHLLNDTFASQKEELSF
ncbi:hypothetical protein DM01DRAFT_1334735 [Hesseltinella vesiculosa]|uniref:Uncharacterized protein n=1 Tax=Hesseltinella vesiculosa TaxID=101127 RepID=A0A1X2GKW5_9FUNG|nr:hypothetical protein DM01DRAFT_1334735 [Hesseltinella vesiculosa]